MGVECWYVEWDQAKEHLVFDNYSTIIGKLDFVSHAEVEIEYLEEENNGEFITGFGHSLPCNEYHKINYLWHAELMAIFAGGFSKLQFLLDVLVEEISGLSMQ